MAAAVNKKARSQQPNKNRAQIKEAKQKIQTKQMKGARSKQATKQVKKPMEKKRSCKAKECHLGRPAKKFLRSYLERLYKSVFKEAKRLMKEKGEPQISGEVLQTALEHYMSKRKRDSAMPAIKKDKKNKSSQEGAERASSPSEKQDAPNQKMRKECQQSATSMSN